MGTMPWIESHTDLENHPKMLLLKSRMRWSKNETVGFLHRFWWTVLKYAPNGVISALPLEVVSETLDMKLDDLKHAIEVMQMQDVELIETRGGLQVVHDWTDFTRIYLRDSLYKNARHKWEAIKRIYETDKPCHDKELESSADRPQTVNRNSTVPTNQPTNQPTNPPAAESSWEYGDPAARLAGDIGIAFNMGPKQNQELKSLIAVDGYEAAKKALLTAQSNGIGMPGLINYASKIVTGERAKRVLKGAPRSGPVTRFIEK
jgi:hypothetical protein